MSMEEKKSHINLESDGYSIRLDMVGTKDECAYMIAHYYISDSEFRNVVNTALRRVMTMGINLIVKYNDDGD